MTPPAARAERTDALSNLARILAVAGEAFAASSNASMTAIARQAGVGVGTLHRHFPTREALIVELYHQEVVRTRPGASWSGSTRPDGRRHRTRRSDQTDRQIPACHCLPCHPAPYSHTVSYVHCAAHRVPAG
ncbi:TetR/AcrR family transcriptional regulator [Streptomyces spinosirectus]